MDILLRNPHHRVVKDRRQQIAKGLKRAFNGNATKRDTQRPRLRLGINRADLGAIARRHRHRFNPIRAQGVRGDRQRQRGVNTAGQTDQYSRKTILLNIIANPAHQSPIHHCLGIGTWGHITRQRGQRLAVTNKRHDAQRRLKHGLRMHRLATRIQHE